MLVQAKTNRILVKTLEEKDRELYNIPHNLYHYLSK
jgi:hypothetical protein